MLDRICIGVDGSDCARRATAVGIAIAEAAGAEVDVLHAEVTGRGIESWDSQAVLEDLDDAIEGASVSVERHAIDGPAAASIVEFATDRDADMLVLGRRGLGGVSDRLLGSVVHAVLRRSTVPVLTVPDRTGPFECTDLLVPTDGSEAAERAAPHGATLAGQLDASVHSCYALDLLTVAGPFNAGGVDEGTIAGYEEDGRAAMDRLVERLHETDSRLPVETDVIRDVPHAAIREYARDHDVDLIVMSSTGGSSALGQVLGSTADRVLRTVDVPVLVVMSDQ